MTENQIYALNTSNPFKYQEYREFFNILGAKLEKSSLDIREIAADPDKIVIHKASQLPEKTIVDDTNLEIEGADFPPYAIKYHVQDLPKYIGSRVLWSVRLAYRLKEQVHLFHGEQKGTLVTPQGPDGFGFDPYFLPDGAKDTLGTNKDTKYSARFKAIKNLIEHHPFSQAAPIYHWDGPWQD